MSFRRAALVALSFGLLTGPALAGPALAGPEPARRVASTKVGSPAQQDSVLRLYRAYFLRSPKSTEISYWADRYASGAASLGTISEFFARSSEFRNRYGSLTDAQFVDLVYQNVLGRAGDAGGRAHWIAQLGKGQRRGSVMSGFSESGEFVRATGTVPPGTGSTSPWSTDQNTVSGQLNASRQAQGKGNLTGHKQAMPKAQAWANHMAARGVLEHTGGGTRLDPSGITGWCKFGENVGRGGSLASVQQQFMNSPVHRANILGDYTQVGTGIAKKGDTYYVVHIFVKPC